MSERGTGLKVLYPGIEPRGLGTEQAESLTGFLSRVAIGNDVRPTVFFKDLLIPVLERHSGWKSEPNELARTKAGQLNGAEPVVEAAVERMADLTGQPQTRMLSFATLNDLGRLERNNRLVGPGQRWCPECWSADQDEPYDRQIWWLSVVEVCPIHRVELVSRCSSCGMRQPALNQIAQIAVCDVCGASLAGTSYRIPENPGIQGERKLWYARQAADLVYGVQTIGMLGLDEDRISEIRRDGLQDLAAHLSGLGNRTNSYERVNRWIGRDRIPSLESLFSMLWRSEWPVENLFPQEYRTGVSGTRICL